MENIFDHSEGCEEAQALTQAAWPSYGAERIFDGKEFVPDSVAKRLVRYFAMFTVAAAFLGIVRLLVDTCIRVNYDPPELLCRPDTN